ncbi:formate dehydrogenase N subunit beta transmembrane domain-containing protein, partial [Neisseria dentiae]
FFHYITVGPSKAEEEGPEVIGKDGKVLHGEEDA